ncbi:sporulation protein [Bacillus xiamenensis]|uniref:YckD family protein n=1 Tax=Bacillus xiamenensis TaxID=1178537 RepID=A0ABT4F2G3_9BACI|nr:YckD family protein [Bacillus xiamenensis]MBG9910854.1 sporulation protein [Bacillus xiamenensis]MCY9576245.1 YckD family protein [Bacillus xiamenensis]
MKKRRVFIMLSMMLLLFGFQVETAHGETPQMEKRPVTQQAKLTTEQQKQIEVLEQQILSKRKEVIKKYVQYGVLTKEQGTHITKRMDEHYNHLKNNGFVPLLKKPQHHRP